MPEFRVETRVCAFPGCSSPFETEHRSGRMYCDDHYGGRVTGRPGRRTEAPELPVDQWVERGRKFLDEHRPLPPVPDHIRAIRREDMGFDTTQHGIALFSDLHWGSVIDRRVTAGLASYNPDKALYRLARWRDGVLRFTQMDQYLVDIDTLHLFALGDDIEGHGDMFATQKLQMAESVGFQVLSFVDHMSTILPEFLSRYKKVKVYKVRGNHGRIAKKARDDYAPDNLELLAWNNIADRVRSQTGGEWGITPNGTRTLTGGAIEFAISPSFMMHVEIMDHTFALRHGDGVKGIAATYTGLVDNKYRLNAIVGEVINYYIIAHHHEAQSIENEIGGESMVNGCFVGPSDLSIRMQRPAANIPSQEFFLMHPRHGITHRHRIRLASKEEMREGIEWIGREEK